MKTKKKKIGKETEWGMARELNEEVRLSCEVLSELRKLALGIDALDNAVLGFADPKEARRLDAARKAIAECVRVDEAKDIRDKAEAIAAYYHQRGASREMQNDVAEVKVRSERKIGKLLDEMGVGKGRPRINVEADDILPTLKLAAIRRSRSRLGKIPTDKRANAGWFIWKNHADERRAV